MLGIPVYSLVFVDSETSSSAVLIHHGKILTKLKTISVFPSFLKTEVQTDITKLSINFQVRVDFEVF